MQQASACIAVHPCGFQINNKSVTSHSHGGHQRACLQGDLLEGPHDTWACIAQHHCILCDCTVQLDAYTP